ncbi:MAG: glycosyltransferase family 4 protein [Candidatus Bathyarchaeota archaeon]|nr:MAG: glycosyltransferase family 4 protein [Candidatus Bathyarchaeota archaeon]
MKVVMVNDCSFVGETLLRNLPKTIESIHLKRSRSFFDKTVKLAWKILKAKGDVYHFNYLLQDCYIGSKLGKYPMVGHAHGTDVRQNLNHFIWKRIVKHNLKKCDLVLVSTPDLLDAVKNYREQTEYLPNPVDSSIFYPKPVNEQNKKLKVLIASASNWKVKGTDMAVHALAKVKNDVEIFLIKRGIDFHRTVKLADSLGLNLNILPPTTHENITEYFWNSDLVIDGFKIGALGMISLEAIACGRPVLNFVSSDYDSYKDFPIKDVDSIEKIVEELKNLSPKLWEKEYTYISKHHNAKSVTKRLTEIYENIL